MQDALEAARTWAEGGLPDTDIATRTFQLSQYIRIGNSIALGSAAAAAGLQHKHHYVTLEHVACLVGLPCVAVLGFKGSARD